VLGVAALFLLRRRFRDEARTMFSTTLWLLTVFVPLQVFLGDQHGLNTFEHQPAKVAAMEGNWETRPRMPLTLFAWPDQDAEANRYALEVPLLGSLILTHDTDGVIPGLKEFPPEDRPPVAIVFFAFRIMVGIGLILLTLVAIGNWLRLRRQLYDRSWYLKTCVAAAPLGFVAVLAGWTTTEVGRQPWTVYGVMRTADSVSPSLSGGDVLVSLLGYMAVYLIIFPAGVYFMARVVRAGPSDAAETTPVAGGRPSRPVRAPPGEAEA
jgi:cytochrome d ubiquinol oxidase subunit I